MKAQKLIKAPYTTKKNNQFIYVKGSNSDREWYGRSIGFNGLTEEEIIELIVKETNERITKNNKDSAICATFENQTIEEIMNNPYYSHARFRSYGITVYARTPNSPTGVMAVRGFDSKYSNEFNRLLSPTESR